MSNADTKIPCRVYIIKCLTEEKQTHNLPASAGDIKGPNLIPGPGRVPGGGMETHTRILAWRIPWTEEPGGLQSIRLQIVRYDCSDLSHMHT